MAPDNSVTLAPLILSSDLLQPHYPQTLLDHNKVTPVLGYFYHVLLTLLPHLFKVSAQMSSFLRRLC